MSLIIKAAQLADFWHKGQVRKYNGRPYIEHPCRVAGRLMLHPLANEINVAAAFLHDVIEDCGVQKSQIDRVFDNERVGDYVYWLTNPSKGSKLSRAERKKMDREHIRNAPQIVKIIKMIDRIDNLNDMVGADFSFAIKYCNESKLLAEVIGDADSELYRELCQEIDKLM